MSSSRFCKSAYLQAHEEAEQCHARYAHRSYVDCGRNSRAHACRRTALCSSLGPARSTRRPPERRARWCLIRISRPFSSRALPTICPPRHQARQLPLDNLPLSGQGWRLQHLEVLLPTNSASYPSVRTFPKSRFQRTTQRTSRYARDRPRSSRRGRDEPSAASR